MSISSSSSSSSSSSEEFDFSATYAAIEAKRLAERAAILRDIKNEKRRAREQSNRRKKKRAARAGAAGTSVAREDDYQMERIPKDRNRGMFERILMQDYFSPNSTFSDRDFRRRFRMHRHVFQRLVDCCVAVDPRFIQRPDCTGKPGFTPIQKVFGVIRWFAYGVSADAVDEYSRIAASTLSDYITWFCDAIIAALGPEYLRQPNDADLSLILQQSEGRGFPGMLGSIDCMHWTWKNCPKALAGQFKSGYKEKPSIILEAVAGPDTWIWHQYFGVAGSNNDINVLHKSPVLDAHLNGTGPRIQYTLNGHHYNEGYFLGDGIYPCYTTFVKSIGTPWTPQEELFKAKHEDYRKDVERCFGILQCRWHIVAQPARGWSLERLRKVMTTCIIMHNMIVEDERHNYQGIETLRHMMAEYLHPDNADGTPFVPRYERRPMNQREEYMSNVDRITNKRNHDMLQHDLIQHVWAKFGHLYTPPE